MTNPALFPGGDPCEREAAWLNTYGDGLPTLTAAAGGPWQVIQAYWPGPRLDVDKTGVYVCWGEDIDRRSGGIRIMPRYSFAVKLWWPVRSVVITSATQGIEENEQQNMRAAANLVVQRVRGFVRDKTHTTALGKFLSVGETPSGQPPRVVYMDAEQTIAALGALRGTLSYYADDLEING